MTHLISTGLHNKKDVLFGNMEEIYHFHNRWGPALHVLHDLSLPVQPDLPAAGLCLMGTDLSRD